MMVGMPGGRQLALSVAGSSFLASASSRTFNSAADAGVREGCSGAGPPGVGKSKVQIPAQSGSEPTDTAAALLCATTSLAGCCGCWPWQNPPKAAIADNAIQIAGKDLTFAPIQLWRLANSQSIPATGAGSGCE